MGGVGDPAAGFDRLRCRHFVSPVLESARTNAERPTYVFLYLTHNGATRSVRSPPQPNPGLPGFGHFKICRKRAGPQPAGEGLRVGVVRFFAGGATEISLHHPLPSPPPQGGREQTEFAARFDS